MPTDDMTLVREYAATQSETAFAQLVALHRLPPGVVKKSLNKIPAGRSDEVLD